MNDDFKISDYKWNPYSVAGLTLSIPAVSYANLTPPAKRIKVKLVNHYALK